MKRLINFCLNNSLFFIMLFIGICIAGVVNMFAAKREAFPKIEYNYVVINTLYVGATAEDVEKLLTIPLEDQLREIDGIDELYSSSLEALSLIVVKLDADLENVDKTVNDLKNAIDRTEDLPDDSQKPIVTELSTAMTPIVDIALTKEGGIPTDEAESELRNQAKILEDRLLELRGVARIDKKGYRDREMHVEVDPALLNRYKVSMAEVIMALAKKNVNIPGGLIRNNGRDILVRTIGEVEQIGEIRKTLVRMNDAGGGITIGDVARIRDSFEEATIINKTNGASSITLTVLKKESADIIELVDRIKREVTTYKKTAPKEYTVNVHNDLSYFVKRRLDVLVVNGLGGFILVLIILVLSYGWRISILTALAIPFAMFATIVWMVSQDVSINLNSMFGLIMALGMLVDNNIVVSDNIYRHLEEKWPLREAVVKGTAEVMMPIAATALTTIASFAPLMFMTGIMGKFMWVLPAVVTVALIASWLESGFMLPVQIHEMQKRRKSTVTLKEEEGGRIFNALRTRYLSLLRACLRHRYLFSLGVTAVFIGTLAFGVLAMKFILFPTGGIETFVIKVEMPTGTSVTRMSEKMSEIEKVVATLPKSELDCFTSRAGIIQEHPGDPDTKRGSNYGVLLVYLTPEEERKRKADEIMDYVRLKTKALSDFTKIEFKPIRFGPPTGPPIYITVKGEDFAVLREISAIYKKHLKTIPGLKDIKDNYEPGKDELRIFVDDRKAALTGISVFDVATTVRAAYAGNVSTSIKKTEEKIDIRVQFPEGQRKNLDSWRSIKIINRMGNLIPLEMVARVERKQGISVIYRKGWRRNINVSAEIDEKAKDVTSVSVNTMLMKRFADMPDRYPGYTVDYEGEFKDTQESISNLMRSFLIAALAIYIILIAVFRSLAQPVIIMAIIPLALVAVVWSFFFHGHPISFLALMGVVGLAGVVVNNSIVFLDFVNSGRCAGLSAVEASLEAGAKRMRPIILSSLTTVMGLAPTAYGILGNDPFLKPMALSMVWGLALGTVITLFVTPVLYTIFTDLSVRIFRRDMLCGKIDVSYHDDEEERAASERIESRFAGELSARLKGEITDELAARFARDDGGDSTPPRRSGRKKR